MFSEEKLSQAGQKTKYWYKIFLPKHKINFTNFAKQISLKTFFYLLGELFLEDTKWNYI